MSREVLAASIIPPTGDCDKLCTSTKVIMKSFETSKSPRRVIAGGVGTVLLRHGNKLKVCMRERAHCVSLAHLAPTNLLCKYARFPRHVAYSSVGRIENTKMLSPHSQNYDFLCGGGAEIVSEPKEVAGAALGATQQSYSHALPLFFFSSVCPLSLKSNMLCMRRVCRTLGRNLLSSRPPLTRPQLCPYSYPMPPCGAFNDVFDGIFHPSENQQVCFFH